MADERTGNQRVLQALQQARTRLETLERARSEPLALVGMACRLPGEVDEPEAFWSLLREGRDAVGEVPAERWDNEALYDADRHAPGKTYTRRGAFMRRLDQFDADFFGISPREAASLDPQQRLLLETSWEALEDAGLAGGPLSGTAAGVYVGIGQSHYSQLKLHTPELSAIDAYSGSGGLLCFASGRLSYWLGLQGPSLSVDTACSSSLVALHLACQSLRSGECSLAVVGGVHLHLAPQVTLFLSRTGVLAPDGRTKAFDAAADGFGRGEGCVVLVLKRLSDAQAHGDSIHALIRGSAVNHDGESAGLTVPNDKAQEQVIREALKNARVEPSEVSFIEAHGTGTQLGDPLEVRALEAVFAAHHTPEHPLFLGSVKSNVGHLEAAAGLAGLLKVVLALKHRQLPAQPHFQTPNPHIPWERLPFRVPTRMQPWSAPSGRRLLAGVSSFGMSGTNAHVLLEEAPEPPAAEASPSREPAQHLLVLSARDAEALRVMAGQYQRQLLEHPDVPLADVCHGAATGRASFEYRAAVVATSREEAVERLSAVAGGREAEDVYRGELPRGRPAPRPVFLFTGQGSQYKGMGRELYETQPTFRAALERCAAVLAPLLERPLLDVLYSPDVPASLVDRTDFTQPALFSLQYALTELWRSWGVEPAAVVGHSVGEYAAACAAGIFPLEQGLRLLAERARAMHALPGEGAMAAVLTSDLPALTRQLESSADTIAIAAFNGPREVVLSGAHGPLHALLATLRAQGLTCRELTVSHAFHSPLMRPMLGTFEPLAHQTAYAPARVDMLCTATARWNDASRAEYWCQQVLQPVRLSQAVEELGRKGYTLFLELGPRAVLSGLGRKVLSGPERLWLPSLREDSGDWQLMLRSMAQLYVRGSPLDGKGLARGQSSRRPRLPTYPFQRRRHWVDSRPAPLPPRAAPPPTAGHPLIGRRLELPFSRELRFEVGLNPSERASLRDHRIHGEVVVAAAFHLAMVLEAVRHGLGRSACRLEDIILSRALTLEAGTTRRVQLLFEQTGPDVFTFRTVSCQDERRAAEESAWELHARGQLRLLPEAPTAAPLSKPETLRERCTRSLEGEAFYSGLTQNGFGLGPLYQWTRRVWLGTQEALCQLEPPRADVDLGEVLLHPGLLDTCFQLLSRFWPAQGTFVPFSIGRLELRRGPSPGEALWCHARGEGSSENGGELTAPAALELLDARGTPLLEVEGFRFRRTERSTLLGARRPSGQELLRLEWRAVEASPPRPAASPSRRWLLCTDEGGLGAGLAWHLRQRGEECVLVAPGQSLPSEPGTFQHVVYLRGVDGHSDARTSTAQLEAQARTLCGGALALTQALAAAASTSPPRLWFITRGAQPIGPGPVEPLQTTLWGLQAVIAREYTHLRPVCVDLDPSATSDGVETLLAALAEDAHEDWVGYRERRRHVARLRPVESRDASASPVFSSEGTYLITGGLGGLGLRLAEWLVAQGARHLLLNGRQPATPRANEVLSRLERAGATVRVFPADVSQTEQAEALLGFARTHLPPLRGVFHAAGVLEDGLLPQQSWERFARVMAPKVSGAWNLHQLTRGERLDCMVFFSSAAGLVGSRGQAGYAAANAFLDTLAHARRLQGLSALSVDWGAWTEVGMASTLDERERRRWTDRGFGTLTPEHGLELLGEALRTGAPQVIALPVDRPALAQHHAREPSAARFEELLGAPPLPSHEPVSLVERLRQAAPHQRTALLETSVRGVLASALGLTAPERLESRAGLFDLGFDSMMALEVKERLATQLGRPLHDTLVFDYPSLEALTGFLAQGLGLLEPPPPPETPRPAVPAVESPSLSEQQLRALSEDEAEQLLLQQLRALAD